MSTIAEIADKVACGGDIAANTGKLGCLSLFGTPEHLLAFRKGTEILPTDTFDIAYLTPLIQSGKVIPLISASAFEDVSAEDTYSTNTSGIKRLNLKGLPEYKFMYEEGHEFYRQLEKIGGYKAFDFVIGDSGGNWMMATKSSGNYAGFTAGHSTPELTKRKVAGGDAESKSFLIQFLDRMQFDENYTILHNDELDFSPTDVPAINGVNLTFDSVPVAGTSVVVKAVLSQDNNSLVEGLLVKDFIYTIGTVAEVPSLVVETTPGVYTLTIVAIASTDKITVQLGVSGSTTTVAESNGVLYRSNELADTIA